jgi:hypothetical protein
MEAEEGVLHNRCRQGREEPLQFIKGSQELGDIRGKPKDPN